MSLIKGNFFYALRYSSSPLYVSLKRKEIFQVSQELGQELGMDIFHNQNLLLYRSILLPAFLYYSTFEDETAKQATVTEEVKLHYPVEVMYRRDRQTIFISPTEVKLENPHLRILTRTKEIFSCDLKTTGGKIILPQNIFEQFKQENILIILEQIGGTWVLEKSLLHLQDNTENKDFEGELVLQEQKSLRIFSYVSVKNIVDAEGGFERLMADIDNRTFHSSQPKKLGKLLEILRAANHEQEESILTSILLDDKIFFEQIQKELFHDDLLSYMNRKELSNILLNIDDDVLKTLENKSLREKYRPFISRNRFARLFNSTEAPLLQTKSKEPKIFNKTLVWEHIQEHFDKKKKRLFFLQGANHKFFHYNNYDKDETLLQNYNGKDAEYLNTNSDMFVCRYEDRQLIIEMNIEAKLACICVEQEKNHFVVFYFHRIEKGILFLQGLARLPQRVVLATLDYAEDLHETFAVFKAYPQKRSSTGIIKEQ